MHITQAMQHPKLFRKFFDPIENWAGWIALLKAVFPFPMSAAEMVTYTKHTGRPEVPKEQVKECWAVIGRRGGKSRVAALVVVHLATFKNYEKVLSPGEVGVAMLISSSRRQAQVALGYVRAFVNETPELKRMVVSDTVEGITLTNRIRIEVHAANPRLVRGPTVIACVLDEAAFFGTEETANSGEEIVKAVKPGMLNVPGAILFGISSPYSKRGILWKTFKKNYGKASDRVLVWRADTLSMNPVADREEIAEAYTDDPLSASAEFGAQFRSDLESFISREALEACVVEGRVELEPRAGIRYRAFVDPSGGANDSMTLAVGHVEGEVGVLDLLREERTPFNPDVVTDSFCAELKRYGVFEVVGDNYAGEWPKTRFRAGGVEYRVAEKHRGDLYLQSLPRITGKRMELLDNERLIGQFAALERSTARSGRDMVDHPPSGHDDVANAAAGLIVELLGGTSTVVLTWAGMVNEAVAALGESWREFWTPKKEPEVVTPSGVILLDTSSGPRAALSPPGEGCVCPNCGNRGSTIVKRGVMFHCNPCGHDWPTLPPVVAAGGRAQLWRN